MRFSGLSAFPLTPMNESGIQEQVFTQLIDRLTKARVDSIGVLGSTGSYPYLTRHERAQVTQLALRHACGIPVMVGIGALRTRDVLDLAEDAQKAGANAVMLAPVSYQTLTDQEVYGLYETVSTSLSIPLCVYDNPATTHFSFSDELFSQIAQLPQVKSIKMSPLTGDHTSAKNRVDNLRKLLPAHVSIGVSGDWGGLTGLKAGCDIWYSAIGGLFPETILGITRDVQMGEYDLAEQFANDLIPIWELFRRHGSIRVIATAAEILGVTDHFPLPHPLRPLGEEDRFLLKAILQELELS
ncbi:4-hydroxy-tetrahydrodipicolinate synthase [Methylobacillus rhizosphaerae]|uniref:4-hydroxy-tetrahydrodipicolinate synthase n=1 Tax=Methylobacillus rhizosphaerae TaxID=551994 RepID=A0A238ZZ52_9PROT|nr:dihydrodipicolinate synthase family protein [Methylobacillus rhizosphaerae]SNR88064.1 4-hydroxy-tetrahydrodipicolinate synthase [Methylobacillus rhizosphaerae]